LPIPYSRPRTYCSMRGLSEMQHGFRLVEQIKEEQAAVIVAISNDNGHKKRTLGNWRLVYYHWVEPKDKVHEGSGRRPKSDVRLRANNAAWLKMAEITANQPIQKHVLGFFEAFHFLISTWWNWRTCSFIWSFLVKPWGPLRVHPYMGQSVNEGERTTTWCLFRSAGRVKTHWHISHTTDFGLVELALEAGRQVLSFSEGRWWSSNLL